MRTASFHPTCMLSLAASALLHAGETTGRTVPFNDNWRFLRGDASGAELAGFDDSRWRRLDLPHD